MAKGRQGRGFSPCKVAEHREANPPEFFKEVSMKCNYCGAEDVQVDRDGFCQCCSEGMRDQEERRERGER